MRPVRGGLALKAWVVEAPCDAVGRLPDDDRPAVGDVEPTEVVVASRRGERLTEGRSRWQRARVEGAEQARDGVLDLSLVLPAHGGADRDGHLVRGVVVVP